MTLQSVLNMRWNSVETGEIHSKPRHYIIVGDDRSKPRIQSTKTYDLPAEALPATNDRPFSLTTKANSRKH
jgi:hypothetical protein